MLVQLSLLSLALPAPIPQFETDSPWIWPLSGDFYSPRELLHTHGQLQFGSGGGQPILHQGIDILADWKKVPWGAVEFQGAWKLLVRTETESVRACFDGVVRSVVASEGWSNQVVVSPEKESPWGLRYLHLESVSVSEGESVFRGELLGNVALWTEDEDATHLDLAFVCLATDGSCSTNKLLDNPLPWMASRPDHVAPAFGDIGSLGKIAFLDEFQEPIDTSTPTGPLTPSVSGKVEILVRVTDRFAQTESAGPVNVPLRIRVNARRLYAILVGYPFPAAAELQHPLVYSNTIEFLDPITDTNAATCYRRDGDGYTSTDQDFYVLATNGIVSDGAWDTTATASGLYTVEVTAEDAAGNASAVNTFVWVKN